MKKAKILFISQEIIPYLPESNMGNVCRYLPQATQERKREIRTFMPRFGIINERRNQLHEVIRLSGMNLIINDNDHPLIIKVASIQQARMQIYFIDNDDYFHRKFKFEDKKGKFFKDNDERAIFFARGVLETVKKLGWAPDLVHCHGWMSSLVPIYIKKAFKDNPIFSDSKIVLSVYDDDFPGNLNSDFAEKIKLKGIAEEDTKHFREPSHANLIKGAIDFSDAVIVGSETINSELQSYISKLDKPVLDYQSPETYIESYNNFYDEIIGDLDD